jgi:serine/threonine protein kinase
VFELLSFNLYELVKQNQFKGLAINLVRVFALQLLDTLILLKEAKIIHCDLKPENILLTRQVNPSRKRTRSLDMYTNVP